MSRGKIEYKGPWGVINSSVPATYLGPNEFSLLQDIYIKDNELRTRPKVTSNIDISISGTMGTFIPVFSSSLPNTASTPFYKLLMWSPIAANVGFYNILNTGAFGASENVNLAFNAQAVYYPVVFGNATYVSGGTALYSVAWNGATFTYTTVTSNYGAAYASSLADHLLFGYVYNYNGSVGTKNQLFWSGANNPTVFNPATDSTAGNQTLNGLANINGIVCNAYSGYITHPGGLVQITPTGNATAPFNIQNVTFSQFPVGNAFAYSLVSRGDFSFYIGYDDVIMITPYGLQGIGGKSKFALFSDIKSSFSGTTSWASDPANLNAIVIGSIIQSFGGGFTYPSYVISIQQPLLGWTIHWLYSIQEDKWTKWIVPNKMMFQFVNAAFNDVTSPKPYCFDTNNNGTPESTFFNYADFNSDDSTEIDFRVEDQDGKFFECVRIRVTYRDLGVCPVTFSLYNVNEDGTYNNPAVQKTINLGTAAADGQIKQVYTDFVATGLFTQLKVTRATNAGSFSIIKVQLLEEGADNLEVV